MGRAPPPTSAARPIDGGSINTATYDIGGFESAYVPWKVYLPLVMK